MSQSSVELAVSGEENRVGVVNGWGVRVRAQAYLVFGFGLHGLPFPGKRAGKRGVRFGLTRVDRQCSKGDGLDFGHDLAGRHDLQDEKRAVAVCQRGIGWSE